jgi:hypothetical protein
LISSKKNWTPETLIVGTSLITSGCGLLSTIGNGYAIDKPVYIYQVILGLGCGLSFSSTTSMLSLNTHPRQIGKQHEKTRPLLSFRFAAAAQGALNQARMLGGSIGLAISTIVLNKRLVSTLTDVVSAAQLLDLQRGLSTMTRLSSVTQFLITQVYAQSFNEDMRICTCISAFSILCALATWQRNRISLEYLMSLKATAQQQKLAVVEGQKEEA